MPNTLFETVVAPVLSGFRRWRKTEALRAELRHMPQDERPRVLSDVGLTESDIDHLIADHPGPETLLPGWLAVAGVDRGHVRDAHPAVLRDMQRVCSRCGAWKRCQSALERGETYAAHSDYCPNAATIDELIVC